MRAAAIILEPHRPAGGFLGLAAASSSQPRYTHSRRRGMGDIIDVSTVMPALNPAPASTIPDYSPGYDDYLYNMITGNLSTGEQQQLIAQQSAMYQQAGMAQPAANAQAASDVNTALANVTAPGAFGITTTGALPSSGVSGTLASIFSAIPTWALVGGIGVGLLIVAKELL